MRALTEEERLWTLQSMCTADKADASVMRARMARDPVLEGLLPVVLGELEVCGG